MWVVRPCSDEELDSAQPVNALIDLHVDDPDEGAPIIGPVGTSPRS